MNRVIQALYQLSDIQFNLLETGKFQLDVSWPTVEFVFRFKSQIEFSNDGIYRINESHPRSLSNDPARMRNESSSSILSMVKIQMIFNIQFRLFYIEQRGYGSDCFFCY